MSTWAARAKARFSKTCPPPTPKTPETHLLGVLGVPTGHVLEKAGVVLGVLGAPPPGHSEKTASTGPAHDHLLATTPPLQPPTDKTDERGVLGVLGVPTPRVLEKAAPANDTHNHLPASFNTAELAPGTSTETTAKFRAASSALDAAAQAIPATPAPQGFDPGEAALQALAQAYCDRTGASDKARQDWRQDIADTPPELRPDLYQHLRAQLPPAPPCPAPAQPPRQPAPMAWSDVAQPWREADRAYLAHWGTCPACQSAARHGARCATGQQLHHTYLAALATT